MKRIISTLAFLMLILAGCGGDFASPTTTDYETTTTTKTATADMTQNDNRPICAGLFVIGGCNVSQTNIQTVHKAPGVPAPPQDGGMSGAGMVGTVVLLCLGFIFCMGVAAVVTGSGGYN